MSLTSGSRLGHYEIVSPLGAGGMGEVYRARDEKLGREVAIKVLPDAFSQDEERVARFGREAKLLAALNHPNIATLHGLEISDGTRFLVMELVEGETLAERIARGPIPFDEALPIFEQVADGLQAAHEKAVIHRDLKPANIKITPDGKVKVLDFGLAKAFEDEVPASDLSHSPTITRDATRAGVILGTAPYMSPEQARGKPVDKRTDIWSFGCVLFEALTGKKAFFGETVTDTIAAVVRAEPPWDALPHNLPARARDLLARCLRKDPARRLHDMADVRLDIEDALEGPESPAPAVGPTEGSWRSLGLTFLSGALLASVVTGLALRRSIPDAPAAVSRLHINLPETDRLTNLGRPVLAFSPDGTRLAYVATEQIYIRALDELEATPVPATEGGGQNPFFSPDGEWLGFWKDGSLQKVRISGGAPVTLCAAANPNGVSWGSDDTIAFQQPGPSIRSVSASGGTPETLVSVETTAFGMHGGQILPGGEAIFFTMLSADASRDEGQIMVQHLETGEQRVLIEGGRDARYLSSGHLVYANGENLMAAPFDAEELQLAGEPVPAVEGVLPSNFAAAQFTVSDNGSLAYVPYRADVLGVVRTLVWVDREGSVVPVSEMQAGYEDPRISPDGRRLAYTIDLSGGLYQVWSHELERGSRTLLTHNRLSYFPVWTPDGSRVAFTSLGEGFPGLYWKPVDGSGTEELLSRRDKVSNVGAFSWTPDGNALAFWEGRVDADNDDIWILQQSENEWVASPFMETPFNELSPMFSPDGRWLAYVSDETGQNEIYVQPYPDADRKWVVSTEGGMEPRWSRDGRELFYRNEDQMLVVAVSAGSDFIPGRPRLLFEGDFGREINGNTNYDIHPDGKRFLMVQVEEAPPLRQITVVLNWFEELERLVPSSN